MHQVASKIEELLRRNCFNFSLREMQTWLPDVDERALRSSMRRLLAQGRVMRASSHSIHWFVVPPECQYSMHLPIEIWLDHFLRNIAGVSYYVGLLSAAAMYGAASHSEGQVQVVTYDAKTQFQVAGTEVHSVSCRYDMQLPIFRQHARWGSYWISSPELTLLDLARPKAKHNSYERIARAICSLAAICRPAPLLDLLGSSSDIKTANRLRAFLACERTPISDALGGWLESNPTER
jgi:AbiEi antitoxin C-terminal domain